MLCAVVWFLCYVVLCYCAMWYCGIVLLCYVVLFGCCQQYSVICKAPSQKSWISKLCVMSSSFEVLLLADKVQLFGTLIALTCVCHFQTLLWMKIASNFWRRHSCCTSSYIIVSYTLICVLNAIHDVMGRYVLFNMTQNWAYRKQKLYNLERNSNDSLVALSLFH